MLTVLWTITIKDCTTLIVFLIKGLVDSKEATLRKLQVHYKLHFRRCFAFRGLCIGCIMKEAFHCSFWRTLQISYFRKVSLTNFNSTFANSGISRLSLGILFFAKWKSKGLLGSESLSYKEKAPGKKFHDKFRESLKHAWMFREHQNQ